MFSAESLLSFSISSIQLVSMETISFRFYVFILEHLF